MSGEFGTIRWFDRDAVKREYGSALPHFQQDGVVYFVTFRLCDSIPREVYERLLASRCSWLMHNPPPHTPEQTAELKRIYTMPLERHLDQGHGSCILKETAFRDELVDIICEYDGEHYEVGDFVVMPNHVHLLTRTGRPGTMLRACRRWKNLSARAVNRSLGRKGRLWQPESFDHIVRSLAKLKQCREYVQKNPRHLPLDHYTLGSV